MASSELTCIDPDGNLLLTITSKTHDSEYTTYLVDAGIVSTASPILQPEVMNAGLWQPRGDPLMKVTFNQTRFSPGLLGDVLRVIHGQSDGLSAKKKMHELAIFCLLCRDYEIDIPNSPILHSWWKNVPKPTIEEEYDHVNIQEYIYVAWDFGDKEQFKKAGGIMAWNCRLTDKHDFIDISFPGSDNRPNLTLSAEIAAAVFDRSRTLEDTRDKFLESMLEGLCDTFDQYASPRPHPFLNSEMPETNCFTKLLACDVFFKNVLHSAIVMEGLTIIEGGWKLVDAEDWEGSPADLLDAFQRVVRKVDRDVEFYTPSRPWLLQHSECKQAVIAALTAISNSLKTNNTLEFFLTKEQAQYFEQRAKLTGLQTIITLT